MTIATKRVTMGRVVMDGNQAQVLMTCPLNRDPSVQMNSGSVALPIFYFAKNQRDTTFERFIAGRAEVDGSNLGKEGQCK
jgi:hypothetical protein